MRFPEFFIILSGGYGSLIPRRSISSFGQQYWAKHHHSSIMASATTSHSVLDNSMIKVYTLGSGSQKYKTFITNHYVPPLVPSAYKGQMGRIGVIGGSPDYTGAPYYAAESALKFGADLVFVFCAKEAAIPIKSYSPELMVTPFYEETSISSLATTKNKDDSCSSATNNHLKQDIIDDIVQGILDKVASFFPRLHSLVIGPGLGRDPLVLQAVGKIIEHARAASLPLVIDADGLWLVAQNISSVHGYSRCILTPNAAEFDRLMTAVGLTSHPPPASDGMVKGDHDHTKAKRDSDAAAVHALSVALGGVTVVKKGAIDIISSGAGSVLLVTEVGSMRRCGGQGDILAGCLGVATYWSGITNRPSEGKVVTVEPSKVGIYPFEWLDITTLTSDGRTISTGGTTDSNDSNGSSSGSSSLPALVSTPTDLALITPQMWSAALACSVTKRAGNLAFGKHHRAMTSPDVMAEIGTAFHEFSTGTSP